jgi:mono/diheme cytochrome c family protein
MRGLLFLMAFGLLLVGALLLSAAPASGNNSVAVQADIGRYLVHDVAKCIECHSPRNSRGDLDRSRLLQGAPLPVKSPFPNDPWAFHAPAIAGLPGWSQAELVHVLTTGTRYSGRRPLPPMPRFRLTEEDATAVGDYLASLR